MIYKNKVQKNQHILVFVKNKIFSYISKKNYLNVIEKIKMITKYLSVEIFHFLFEL